MYRQGLSSYEVQEYSKSLQIFEQLDKLISGNPDVENHMQQAIILSNKPEQLGHQQQLQNQSNTTSNFRQGSSIQNNITTATNNAIIIQTIVTRPNCYYY